MRTSSLLLPLSILAFACNSNEFGPVASPASEHPAYAAEYPERVENNVKQAQLESGAVDEFPKHSSAYVADLQDPDWSKVRELYELADRDGRSAHYAEVRAANDDVAEFFVDEKEELAKKISGGVNYQAEQKGCKVQFYGAVDRGLEKGVEERFEEREKDASRAQAAIERDADALGKPNADKLKEQTREISQTAYLVYVLMAQQHQQLKQLVAEEKQVQQTLDTRIEELKSSRSSNETPAQREARNQEMRDLTMARGKLESVVATAKERLKTSEDKITAARKAYDEALQRLLAAVDAKMAK